MVLNSVFASLMANDPDAAFKRLDELDAGARTMAFAGMCQSALFDDAKRQRMLETIDAMPEGTEKTNSRQMLLSQWAMFAPEEATAWVAKQPPAAQKDLRETMGGMLFMTDPKNGAAFMMDGATDQEKPERYSMVVEAWARLDPKAASPRAHTRAVASGNMNIPSNIPAPFPPWFSQAEATRMLQMNLDRLPQDQRLFISDSLQPCRDRSAIIQLADRIAREPGFRSVADVARWMEGMRVGPGVRLDRGELEQCAEHYRRPAVRWLLRYAEKQQLTNR